MDEKLQQIFLIQPLQDKAITYRTNGELFRKMMKETCIKEVKNLVNVEIDIVATELKMPDPRKIPPISKQEIKPQTDLDALLEDFGTTMKSMDLL